jgi:hypothetical protein
MTFIQDGEAHSASQSTLQTIQSLLEMSSLLLAKLVAYNQRLRDQQKDANAKQAEPDPLSEQEKELTNEMAAISCIDVVNQYGEDIQGESGELMRVYQAEGFVVSTQAQDETGYPLYHVYNHEGGEQYEVLSFQRDPKEPDKFIFFETEAELQVEQRISLIKAFQHTAKGQLGIEGEGIDGKADRKTEGKGDSLSGIARVKQRFEQLGHCAPEGTKALLVAHYLLADGEAVLNEQGKDSYSSQNGWSAQRQADGSVVVTGSNYQFHKGQDGTLSVAYANTPDASSEHLYQMKPDGSVHQQGGVEWDRTAFQQMHSTLAVHQSQNQSSQAQQLGRSTQRVPSAVGEGR